MLEVNQGLWRRGWSSSFEKNWAKKWHIGLAPRAI